MSASCQKLRYDRARLNDGPVCSSLSARENLRGSGRNTQFAADSTTQEDIVKADVRLGSLACMGLLLVAVVAACTPKSHEEKVAAERARYSATLNGFVVREEVVAAEPVGDESESDPASGEMVEGEEGDEMVEPEVAQNVLVDILVRHDSNDPLPGVTVDISQVDANEIEKGRWLFWVDTEGLAKATPIQISHVLESVSYEEGDGFFAEVRPVAEGERGDYAEFGGS